MRQTITYHLDPQLQLTKVGVIPPDQLHRRQRLTIIPLCVFKVHLRPWCVYG